jgi:tetratricopeptide (TPR) repeat protein
MPNPQSPSNNSEDRGMYEKLGETSLEAYIFLAISRALHDLENGRQIRQSIFDGTVAESIQTGDIHQKIFNLPQPRLRPTSIPQNVPFRGTRHFIGRAKQLDALHRELQRTEQAAISVIAGMGGIGKTELAVQYAWQHLHAYSGGVCWIQAQVGDQAAQLLEFVQLYLGLKVPRVIDERPLTLPERINWCWNHWEPSGNVLIVLDNVTTLSNCQSVLLAPPARFRILLTTRERNLDPNFYSVPLDILSRNDAVALLKELVTPERIESDLSAAETLCKILGYLPLAIELVGRYLVHDRGLSLAVLVQVLEDQGISSDVLHKTYDLMTAQCGCLAAFELSWQSLDLESQEVACLLSCFASDVIPWSLAEKAMRSLKRKDFSIGSARRQLDNLHLVQAVETVVADGLKLHPLLREFFQGKSLNMAETGMNQQQFQEGIAFFQGKSLNMTKAGINQQQFQEAIAVTMVEIAQQIPDTPTLEMIQSLSVFVPHLSVVAQQYAHCLKNDNLIWPFIGLGRFYASQGLYGLAEPWYQLYLKTVREHVEHPDVARIWYSLAVLYYSQGRYNEAEPLFLEALEMQKRLMVEEHPDLARSLNNLAFLYHSQGRYSEAEPLFLEALEMWKRLLGGGQFDVASSLNDLAVLHYSQGRYSEAEPLFLEALEMRKRLLGEEHPDVAINLNNLASLYRSQERYSEAEPLFLEALGMRKRLLGEEHPDVARSLNNLASLYKSQGQYSEAEPLYVEALEIHKLLLGNNHPNVAINLSNLASLYRSQGRYGEAEPLYVEALEIQQRLLGNHPEVVNSLNDLALIYYSQGRRSEASLLYAKASSVEASLRKMRNYKAQDFQHLKKQDCLHFGIWGMQQSSAKFEPPSTAIKLVNIPDVKKLRLIPFIWLLFREIYPVLGILFLHKFFPLPRPRPIGIPQNILSQGTRHFVGRTEQLDAIHQELQRTEQVTMVTGVKGVGKTELAVQYAWQYLQEYSGGVCWIQAQVGDLAAQIVKYVQLHLGLEVPRVIDERPLTLPERITWCWNHWEPSGRVLIVLDNVTELTLPTPPTRFQILLTTRERELALAHSFDKTPQNFCKILLNVLSKNDAVTLLKELVNPERIESDLPAAEILCERLRYLPLAIELVGRYLAQDRRRSLAMLVRDRDALAHALEVHGNFYL